MKRAMVVAWLAVLAHGVTTPLAAQDLQLPEYTVEQRWDRLAFLTVGLQAALVALGDEHGMTPEETGQWLGEFFSDTWLSGAEASQLLTGMNRNFMAFPGASVEVLASTPTTVTARFNRPQEEYFGPAGETIGVPGEDILTMLAASDDAVAEWAGVAVERRAEDDADVLTLETLYGPIEASPEIRWARGSYLSWLTWLQFMSHRMADGTTAREIGEQDAELYGPSWSARTPWRFFRGMIWNQMTDPNAECEVLSASPTEVRARCAQHYRQVADQNEARFGVTAQDVFEANRAFAEGVAEHLGMVWTEELVDGSRMITVTAR